VDQPEQLVDSPLSFNEVMSNNDGAWVDEIGQTDDWIELVNAGETDIDLSGYSIAELDGVTHVLPALTIAAGETLLLWADDDTEQGPAHLSFKLASAGEVLQLRDPRGRLIEALTVPALEPNIAWARRPDVEGEFDVCIWSTPGRANGELCGPPLPPTLGDEVEFSPWVWPQPWPEPPTLSLNELHLDFDAHAGFVELVAPAGDTLSLEDVRLEVAAISPTQPWPELDGGVALSLPATLAAGEHLAIDLSADAILALSASPNHEGVVTLFQAQGQVIDRLDFVHWPAGGTLSRQPDASGPHIFCEDTSKAEANGACSVLPSRPVSSYLRHLRTPGDFAALASGSGELGLLSVKVVQDMQHQVNGSLAPGDPIYFVEAARWDLHYTFVREVIEGLPTLDRCDPVQAAEFNAGRSAFSNNYYSDERRFLLPTLSLYGGSQLQVLHYFRTDTISADQLRHGVFSVLRHVFDYADWVLHVDADQIDRGLALDGELPMVGPNGPYAALEYQPLNQVVGYGELAFVPAHELATATLGPQTILVTDLVPNDIPFVAGLITESFQTPLSHVNVLSKNRGSPNMALAGARDDPRIEPMFGELVRLEVGPTQFEITLADPAEAAAFWQQQGEVGPPLVPAIDPSVRGVVPLDQVGIAALPSIGAKAAQLAELLDIDFSDAAQTCLYKQDNGSSQQPTGVQVRAPATPFAIPVVHYLEHFQASGAEARLAELMTDPGFVADPSVRAAGLAEVRALILEHPVDPALLAEVEAAIAERFGHRRVRLRSSSNTEDLAGFSGAGLYSSSSAELGDPERPVDGAMRTAWASLWNARAWDERAFFNVSQADIAMAILCHEAFRSERANGVGVSRDISDPDDDIAEYINVQFGEASVTNPAPGISADSFVHHWWGDVYVTRSSFPYGEGDGAAVLSPAQIGAISCALDRIQAHFGDLLNPDGDDDWFTMEIEFKLIGDTGDLMIKQARPYSLGRVELPANCD
jgi:hypothetical protein